MSGAQAEVGRPLALSLLAIWVVAIGLYFIIDPIFNAHQATWSRDHPNAPFGYSGPTLTPSTPFVYALFFTFLFFIHWWLSGLFGKPGLAKKPIANAMLVAAGLAALVEIIEQGTLEFYDYSLFCRPGEPTTVILVDEVYRCERSFMVRRFAQWSMLLLPIVAIPVRLLESRRGYKKG